MASMQQPPQSTMSIPRKESSLLAFNAFVVVNSEKSTESNVFRQVIFDKLVLEMYFV
jgi:hypothetical protein